MSEASLALRVYPVCLGHRVLKEILEMRLWGLKVQQDRWVRWVWWGHRVRRGSRATRAILEMSLRLKGRKATREIRAPWDRRGLQALTASMARQDLRDLKAILGHKVCREYRESSATPDRKALRVFPESRAIKAILVCLALLDHRVILVLRVTPVCKERRERRGLLALKVRKDWWGHRVRRVQQVELALRDCRGHREILALRAILVRKGPWE